MGMRIPGYGRACPRANTRMHRQRQTEADRGRQRHGQEMTASCNEKLALFSCCADSADKSGDFFGLPPPPPPAPPGAEAGALCAVFVRLLPSSFRCAGSAFCSLLPPALLASLFLSVSFSESSSCSACTSILASSVATPLSVFELAAALSTSSTYSRNRSSLCVFPPRLSHWFSTPFSPTWVME